MISHDGKPMSLDDRPSLTSRLREFVVFLVTVAAVLAGAEAVMLLRSGEVEAGTSPPEAAVASVAVQSVAAAESGPASGPFSRSAHVHAQPRASLPQKGQ